VKLENTFTVPVAADVAWQVLLDVERIAPCMPGATLTGHEEDSFTGTVKVKVGPVSLTYGGTATFSSLDEANHVAVIEAAGKETRGSGTAKAIITARMREESGSTTVDVETDLTITGKPAQFGRGVMAEISGKLITQFADCLAAEITGDGDPPAATSDASAADEAPAEGPVASEPAPEVAASNGSSPAASSAPASNHGASGGGDAAASAPGASAPGASAPARPVAAAPRPSPEAIDLLGTAGLPVLKRVAPALAAVGVLLGFVLLRHRRR
jgi:carbon monoxide dehydrogenase subunit G